MTRRANIILLIVLIALGLGVFWNLRMNNDEPGPIGNNNGGTTTPNTSGTTTTPAAPVQTSMVRVSSPLTNATVTSPITVTGEARGNWYFEASFPIRVLDANGKELGVSYAQAQGEWMTTSFVPFSGTVSFTAPTTDTGTLVLEKDNPSGLPENAAEVRVPIKFNRNTAQVRIVQLYYYNENKDQDQSGNVLCSAQGLVPIQRTIPLSNTPIQDAVRELLKGPTASERAQLPGTEFPLAGVTLTGASLSNGVLTLSVSDPQNRTSGGSCRIGILRAQIEATAKQFGGVTSVLFAPADAFQP